MAERKRRQDREFRIMFRPTFTVAGVDTPKKPAPPRRKLSRMMGHTANSLVDDLCTKIAERSGHWALVVLKEYVSASPSKPPSTTPIDPPVGRELRRIPITADDPRIDRVLEIRRKEREGEKGSAWGKKPGGVVKGDRMSMVVSTAWMDEISEPSEDTYTESSEEDRYSDDEGFPGINKAGGGLEMRISRMPRNDFSELKFDHLGGALWEILTGIEARTKFTNTELRHEATRIWKRQQNYTLLQNNCQQFCILLAITIRAKSHAQLRVLHGETVQRQIKGEKFGAARQ